MTISGGEHAVSDTETNDRRERLRDINLQAAMQELGNRVYSAAIFIEQLEDAGLIYGNGRHIAQHISAYAQGKLLDRWRDESALDSVPASHPAIPNSDKLAR